MSYEAFQTVIGPSYVTVVHKGAITKMVERVPWFSPIHYEILGFFEQHDIRISPRDLAKNIDYDRGYTGKACRRLEDVDLLENDEGSYSLTSRGREFLVGSITANDIGEPEP